jgi:NitT/TauT family transport system permease protein
MRSDHRVSARPSPAVLSLATLRLVVPPVIVLAGAAVAWQLVALHNPQDIPRIGAIWQQLSNHPRIFLGDTGSTVLEAAVGLACSFVVAFALATLMCHLPSVERGVMPLAVIINVTPVVAFAPILAIIFRFGYTPKFIVAAIVAFFPLLVNSLAGLRAIDPETHEVLRSLHASRREVFLRLRLPSSLPFLFAAARVCLPLSIVGAVVAEFVTSGYTSGLGVYIALGVAGGAPGAGVFAAIAILAALGVALTILVTIIERRVLSWHGSIRADA